MNLNKIFELEIQSFGGGEIVLYVKPPILDEMNTYTLEFSRRSAAVANDDHAKKAELMAEYTQKIHDLGLSAIVGVRENDLQIDDETGYIIGDYILKDGKFVKAEKSTENWRKMIDMYLPRLGGIVGGVIIDRNHENKVKDKTIKNSEQPSK